MRPGKPLRLGRFGRTVLAITSTLAVTLPVVVLWSASRATAETTTVVDQFGTSGGEYPQAVITDASGNVYVTGQVGGTFPGQTSAGGPDAFLRKYSSAGAVQWTVQFGSGGGDEGMGLAVDSSGNVYVAGYVNGVIADCDPACTSAGDTDAFVRQYTPSGSVGWTRQFGTSEYEEAYGVAVSGDHVYVAGTTLGGLTGSNIGDTENGFIREYDTSGNEGWTQQFSGTNVEPSETWYSTVYLYGIAADSSGNVYVSGSADGLLDSCAPDPCSFDASNSYDAFVRQYTASGSLGWTREFGAGTDSNTDWMLVAVDGSGNVDVGGRTDGTLPDSTGTGSAFVRQYSPTGTLAWSTQFGGTGDEVDMLAADASGNVYATGRLAGFTDTFVNQWSSDGTPGWSRLLNASGGVGGNGIAVDGSGNVWVTGTTNGAFAGFTSSGDYDGFLAEFSPSSADGTSTALAADPEPSIVGNTVTYTATVTPSTGTLDGGTVTFTEGTTTLCNAVAVDTGTGEATCQLSNSTIGQHVVAATYSGTTAFDRSWGYTTHTVDPATIGTSTGVSAAPEPSIVGSSVTYTATVTPTSGTLDGGTVAFKDGITPISGCSAQALNGADQATCSVTYSTVGSHAITATYSGTTTYDSSTSTSITHEVTYGLDLMSRTATKPGGTIKVKLALINASGDNVSASTTTLTVTGVTGPSSWGNTVNGTTMTYLDRHSPYYQYSLAVPATQASGSYQLQFTASGDSVTHHIPITVK